MTAGGDTLDPRRIYGFLSMEKAETAADLQDIIRVITRMRKGISDYNKTIDPSQTFLTSLTYLYGYKKNALERFD